MEKKYKYLLFDLDDTLIDNYENVKFAFKKMLEHLHKDFSGEYFFQWFEFDKQFWLDRLEGKYEVPEQYQTPKELYVHYIRSLRYYLFFGDISMETAFALNKIYLSAVNEKVIPIDGAFETLQKLSENYKIYIATNGPSSAVESKLSKIDCLRFVSGYFSADMTKGTSSKPTPEFFEEMLDFINFHNKKEIVFIGNSLRTDIAGAKNFGIDTIWLNLNGRKAPENLAATYEISSLSGLLGILDGSGFGKESFDK